jgi:hypothetical protein
MHVKLLLSENLGTDGRIIKMDFKEVEWKDIEFISLSRGLMAGSSEDHTEPRFGDKQEF